MKLSDVKTDADWGRYLDQKAYESHKEVSDEMNLGDTVDEYGDVVTPDMWYWKGVAREMNPHFYEDLEEDRI